MLGELGGVGARGAPLVALAAVAALAALVAFHHGAAEHPLLLRSEQYTLLDRLLRDQPEDANGFGLADPMRAVHRLQIHLRVPVRVEEHDRIGRRQVDAHAARASRDNVGKHARVSLIKLGNVEFSLDFVGGAVHAQVPVLAQAQKLLEQIERLSEGGEDEDPRFLTLQPL